MTCHEAKVTSKGQVTIPQSVREHLKLETGDIVDFYLDDSTGEVRVRARNGSASELFGTLDAYASPRGQPASVEQINDAIGKHMADEDTRIQAEWRQKRGRRAQQRNKPVKAAE